MIRRFVNVVAENYKSGMYSLHRLDTIKHLFYTSTAQAQELPAASGHGDAQPPMVHALHDELPPPITPNLVDSKLEFLGLVSPRRSEGRILCANKAGHAVLYDADSHSIATMPSICGDQGFKGPVHASVSVARAGAKEEDLYILHGGDSTAGDLPVCFHVLRFGPPGQLVVGRSSCLEGWYWQSLPLPPFVNSPQCNSALSRSYTVLDGGRTICLSYAPEGFGTYCFDTVRREWSHAGDWMLTFDGGVEYDSDLKIWLGVSLDNPHHLSATSALSVDQPLSLKPVWQDHTPKEFMATKASIINLGVGRFCIAKAFKAVPNTDIEKSSYFFDWDMVGMVIRCGHNSPRLRTFKHKSIGYKCANNSIRCVL